MVGGQHYTTFQNLVVVLGVALQLGAVRYLGFCPTHLQAAPLDTIAFLAQLHIDPTVFHDYGTRRMTRSAHFQAVVDHLGFRRVQDKEQEQLLTWLTECALEHDKPTLLLQMTGEHLKQQKMLRPGVTVLERLVVTARAQAHYASFHRLQPLLTSDCMALLDRLLVPDQETANPLYPLRQHATSNTPPALLDALDKLTLLHSWAVDQRGYGRAQSQPPKVPGAPRTQVHGASPAAYGTGAALSDPARAAQADPDRLDG